MAVVNTEKCEEHPKRNLAQNLKLPRPQEHYIAQVFDEIERKITKKLSQ